MIIPTPSSLSPRSRSGSWLALSHGYATPPTTYHESLRRVHRRYLEPSPSGSASRPCSPTRSWRGHSTTLAYLGRPTSARSFTTSNLHRSWFGSGSGASQSTGSSEDGASSTRLETPYPEAPDVATPPPPAPEDLHLSALDPSQPSSLIHPLSELFLSIPSHLPSPVSYTILIITLTLILRSTITLPISIWSRRRTKRLEELVRGPEGSMLKAYAKKVGGEVLEEVKKRRFMEKGRLWSGYLSSRGHYVATGRSAFNFPSHDRLKKEIARRVAERYRQLTSQHSCSPLPTIILPPLIHIPLFITTTWMLRDACLTSPATSPLFLEGLTTPDPTLVLPFAVGMLALLNVELNSELRKRLAKGTRVVREETDTNVREPLRLGGVTHTHVTKPRSQQPQPQQQSLREPPSTKQQKKPSTPPKKSAPPTPPTSHHNKKRFSTTSSPSAAAPRPPPNPPTPKTNANATPPAPGAPAPEQPEPFVQRVVTNALRLSAILFIPIASLAPSAVTVYWITSHTFSLVQTLAFGFLDWREKEKKKVVAAGPGGGQVK